MEMEQEEEVQEGEDMDESDAYAAQQQLLNEQDL